MGNNALAKQVARTITIGTKDAVVDVHEFQGRLWFMVRFTYETALGETMMGKNGITVPLEDAPYMLQQMMEVYKEATGNSVVPDDE